MQNFKNSRKLASYSKIKNPVMGFYSLPKWFDSKTFLLSHDLLVPNA
jgi:hypothetical protein